MMYSNQFGGIISQDYIHQELAKQHRYDQMRKSFDCAKKLDDLLKSIDEVEPEYRQVALYECWLVTEMYMKKHGMW